MVRCETARHKQTITTSPLDEIDNNYQNHPLQGENVDGGRPFAVAHLAGGSGAGLPQWQTNDA
jgi:hypothetical protein